MIGELFKALLITSLAGSAFAVVISLLRPVTKKLFGYSWHYYIWLCVLFVMLMPVRFNVNTTPAPNIATQTIQTQQEAVSAQPETTENVVQTAPAQKPQLLQKATVIWDRIIYNRMNILAYLWLIGAIALMLLNVVRYVRLNIKIHKNGEVISCPETREYTDRKINVRAWENVASPFMTGVFRPTLILPKTELSEEQLHNILRHEMTHFKRHDILYKWFAEFVKCIHWFNPISWYVSKQIASECEISCDMAVTKNMTGSEEMSYVSTILSLLPTGKSKQLPLTTQMASSKKFLKRRFIMIKNKKTTSRFMSVLSAVIAVIMLSTTVFASGVLSDLTTDDYTIEILNNGEKIELTNKPFIENGEVYVPLRELFEKMGIMSNPENY
ncbi:MAG: M56 family metallopeptidase, partial [Clostridia bacterium]|nr:M56 family metallopeptidase [Clostridia bacterium]